MNKQASKQRWPWAHLTSPYEDVSLQPGGGLCRLPASGPCLPSHNQPPGDFTPRTTYADSCASGNSDALMNELSTAKAPFSITSWASQAMLRTVSHEQWLCTQLCRLWLCLFSSGMEDRDRAEHHINNYKSGSGGARATTAHWHSGCLVALNCLTGGLGNSTPVGPGGSMNP